MKPTLLPAYRHDSCCPACSRVVTYFLFLASFYDFATYVGRSTRSYYRLSLDYCHYANESPESVLCRSPGPSDLFAMRHQERSCTN